MKKQKYLSKFELVTMSLITFLFFIMTVYILLISKSISMTWVITNSIIFAILLIVYIDNITNYILKVKVKIYYVTLNITFDNDLGESFNKVENHYIYSTSDYYELEELDSLYKHINEIISNDGFILKNVYAETINYIGTTCNSKL